MKKIALVYRSELSPWVSCQSIRKNLEKSYRLAFPQAEIQCYFLNESSSLYEIFRETAKIREFAPDCVSIIDHAPHPLAFVKALAGQYGVRKLPRLVFHVFGDFTLHPASWIELEEILRKTDTRFVCASDKQAALVRSLVEADASTVVSIPFPIDREEYSFSPAERKSARRELKCRDEEAVFLYTGRMSAQKNPLLLIQSFVTYLRQINPRACLWLAGPIDDIGSPFIGAVPPAGVFERDLLTLLTDGVPEEFRGQVRYLGDLDAAELRKFYHAADYYVSLSTHNDEDYGMAPAEAACCGLPLILSDWAGYSSFGRIDPKAVFYVPVTLQERKIAPGVLSAVKGLVTASSRRFSLEDQAALSRAAYAYCSCESVGAKLVSYLGQDRARAEFTGFTRLFSRMAQAFQARPDAPYLEGATYSALYREVYSVYLSDEPAKARITKLLKSTSAKAESLNEFYRKPWFKNEQLTYRTDGFMHPHGKDYFSPLSALFLHQVKSLDLLTPYKTVAARDGFLSLLLFFSQNPVPVSSEPLLIINRRFAVIVPEAWRRNVAYYSFGSVNPKGANDRTTRDVYVVLTLIDERQFSLAYLEKKLRELAAACPGPDMRFHCVTFLNTSFEWTDEAKDRKSLFNFEVMRRVSSILGDRARAMSLKEFQQTDFRGSVFLDVNEFDFYYSDSHVVQTLMKGGSVPFSGAVLEEIEGVRVDLSLSHFAKISWDGGVVDQPRALAARGFVRDFVESESFQDEYETFLGKGLDSGKEKFVPLSFEKMAYSLASDLLGELDPGTEAKTVKTAAATRRKRRESSSAESTARI